MRLVFCLLSATAVFQLSVLAIKGPPLRQSFHGTDDFLLHHFEKHNQGDVRNKREHVFDVNKMNYERAAGRLMEDLFLSKAYPYDRDVSPEESTVVQVELHYQCANYDESSRVLTSKAMELLTWTDDRLRWDPEDYSDLTVVRIPWHRIWTPTIKVDNVIEPEQRDFVNVLLYSSGKVIWALPVYFKTYCKPTATKSASCELSLGTRVYDSEFLPLSQYNEGELIFDTTSYMTECPYNVTLQRVTTETVFLYSLNSEDPHQRHRFQFDVKKKQ